MVSLLRKSAVLLSTLAIISGTAAAQTQTGTNTNTGPDSSNTVANSTTCDATIHNDNNVDLNNSNSQTSSSGGGTTAGNTSGGGATTGSSNNSNSVDLSLNISNHTSNPCIPSQGGGGGGGGGGNVTPPAGGRGGETTPGVVAASSISGGGGGGAATSLPNTEASTPAGLAGASVLALGSLAAASRFGASIYGRLKGQA